jgi:hypothetical protein
MRNVIFRFAAPVTLAACTLPHFEPDPYAAAPRYDRWEATVAASPDSAYQAALDVVIEEGYTIALAARGDRVITTNLRLRHVGSGLDATSYHVRFTLSVRPAGADSARLGVVGEQCFGDDLTTCTAITTFDGGTVGAWQFVRRLGEAARRRLNTIPPPAAVESGRREAPDR